MRIDIPYIPAVYRYLEEFVVEKIERNERLDVSNFFWCGGRFTGKTGTSISFIFYLSMIFPHKKINAYIVRKQISNVREMFDQVVALIPTRLKKFVKTNKSSRTIWIRNTRIECLGLAKNRGDGVAEKLGKARLPSDIRILIFDEAWEFSATDFVNVKMSVADRSAKWVINFCLSNPYVPDSPFFKEVLKFLPWNEKRIKNEYEYKKRVDKTIYHWIVPYAVWNEDFMVQTAKEEVENAKKDPLTHEVVKWGRPLRIGGGIYSGLIHRIKFVETIPKSFSDGELFCGIDIGSSHDPTAVVFGIESDGKVLVYNELIIDNRQRIFDERKTAHDIVKFLYRNWRILRWRVELIVYTDNDQSFADTLNQVSNSFRVKIDEIEHFFSDFVSFVRISVGYRKTRIADRVKGVIRCLSNGQFYILKGKAKNLLREFQLSDWKTTTSGSTPAVKTRADGNDDSLNALEYGLREKIYSLAQYI